MTRVSSFSRRSFSETASGHGQPKAYFIDTIINDRPIPLLFFQRVSSAQTGRPGYSVIDGQQRLRAIFEFLDDRFRLSQSDKKSNYYNRKFSEVPQAVREAIESYDLAIQELIRMTELSRGKGLPLHVVLGIGRRQGHHPWLRRFEEHPFAGSKARRVQVLDHFHDCRCVESSKANISVHQRAVQQANGHVERFHVTRVANACRADARS